jgi:hypothetical protein
MEKQESRTRLNAKQTAKGLWQLDVTIETFGIEEPDITASRHVLLIQSFKEQMRLAKMQIVGEGF